MTADVINRPLFRTLVGLGVSPDEAMDAAGGFVTTDQVKELATKEDVRLAKDELRTSFEGQLKLLEGRLMQRIVLFVGGSMIVLTQVVPPGRLYELTSALIHHLTS